MSTARVIRKAIRDVDGLNREMSRELERRLIGAYGKVEQITFADLSGMMNIVDDVVSPVYGSSRLQSPRSPMFRAIVGNMKIASDEAFRRPFVDLDRRLAQSYPDSWPRIRRRMPGFGGTVPAVFAAIGGQPSLRERKIRNRIFDPQRRWVAGDGYRLSDRVWLAGEKHRKNIDKALRNGIKRGDGIETIAHELRQYANPGAAPVKRYGPRFLRKKRPSRVEFGDGRGAYAARRLARTEVQRVAHEATVEAVRAIEEETGLRVGVQYALSPAHPKIDICDEYAAGSSRGFPRGVYTPDEVPSIPHPNCLCGRRPWVPSRADVMRSLEEQYAGRRPVSMRWDRSGDGTGYAWDTTNWGDSVDWRSDYHDLVDLGRTEDHAYRIAYDNAKNDYLIKRGDDLQDYFDSIDETGTIAFDKYEAKQFWVHDNWELADERIDNAVRNVTDINDLLWSFDDFGDYAPQIEISGGRRQFKNGTRAHFDPDDNIIRINIDQMDDLFDEESWLDNMFWAGGERWGVGDSTYHTAIHEFGHARHILRTQQEGLLESIYDPDNGSFLHYILTDDFGRSRTITPTGMRAEDVQRGLTTLERTKIAREVSDYAAEDALEFIAETYTGLVTGERYSDDIMDLYFALGGEEPSRDVMEMWDDLVKERRPDTSNARQELLDAIADSKPGGDLYDDDMFDDVFDDDLLDEMLPGAPSTMTNREIADALGIDEDELDDIIKFGLDFDLISEEDFFPVEVGGTGGPSLETYRLIMARIDEWTEFDDP